MNNLQIKNENGQLVIDSREVAEMIGKEHKHLLRDIKGYIEVLNQSNFGPVNFFIEWSYEDSKGENRPCYLLTKKGCDMVANKMTGEKGILFTATYVTKFEEMEKTIKNQVDTSQLSPELQMFKQIFDSVAMSQLEQKRLAQEIEVTKVEVQAIRDVVKLDTTSWKEDTTKLINKIAQRLGGNEHIKDVRKEIYGLLDKRMAVNLEQRLTNKRRRMADEGVCKSTRDKLNKVSVIEDDKKLIEGYVAIVKEMSIKYGVA